MMTVKSIVFSILYDLGVLDIETLYGDWCSYGDWCLDKTLSNLSMDSVDITKFALELEECFDIEINPEELTSKTIEQIIEMVENVY